MLCNVSISDSSWCGRMREVEEGMFDPNAACDYCGQGSSGFAWVATVAFGMCLAHFLQAIVLDDFGRWLRLQRWRRRGGWSQYDDVGRKHVDKVDKVDTP